MASADLRDELNCSICLSIYTDPVTLRCGHNFCRVCIDCVLDTQEWSGVYSCPDCRAESQERPALQKNITLCNIAERFLSTEPEQEETGISCTYCIHSPVPAVKSCLMCEASLCVNHLRVHSKAAEHVITEPNNSLRTRKCSIHMKILEYYCTEDAACICVTCCLAGEHVGHRVEQLHEASNKKKEILRNILEKLLSKRADIEERLLSLQERRRQVQENAAGEREGVTALFIDLRRQLEDLEKRVLSEISRQEDNVSVSVSDLIQELDVQKDELSRKMRHIEELCNVTDPVTVLQEPVRGDLCDTEERDSQDRERHDKQIHDVGDLGEGLISGILKTAFVDIVDNVNRKLYVQNHKSPEASKGLADIATGVKRVIYVEEPSDLLLDINTAGVFVRILEGLRTLTWSGKLDSYPKAPEKFQCSQVLSTKGFLTGRHKWRFETSTLGNWRIGVSYRSVYRKGYQSITGNNDKSWCLCRSRQQYSLIHNEKEIKLHPNLSCNLLGIYLDYEAGRLSFYELCNPCRHLYTFTVTFNEPLHASIWIYNAWVRIRSSDYLSPKK